MIQLIDPYFLAADRIKYESYPYRLCKMTRITSPKESRINLTDSSSFISLRKTETSPFNPDR